VGAVGLHPPSRSASPPSRHSYVADAYGDDDDDNGVLYEQQPRYEPERDVRARDRPTLSQKSELALYIHQLTLKDIRLRDKLTRSLPREIERYSGRII
jgi:hypothetical protein